MEDIGTKEMNAIEMNAEYYGLSKKTMMEIAGSSLVKYAARKKKVDGRKVLIYCGTGGNGGDGFVASRYFSIMGANVKVLLLGSAKKITNPSARQNYELLKKIPQIELEIIKNSSSLILENSDFIIDSLLGTGIGGSIREPIASCIDLINNSIGYKISVDIPTGINPDSGEVSSTGAIKADSTVTFHKPKTGIFSQYAKPYVGELHIASIGIPRTLEMITGPGDIFLSKQKRLSKSHKGDNGKVLVIGGSSKYTGAPALSGMGALRTGVDLVTIIAPKSAASIIAKFSPNLIVKRVTGKHISEDNISEMLPLIEKSDSVLIGPGLGRDEETLEAIKEIIKILHKKKKPTVIDADALHVITRKTELPEKCVLTPHHGEFLVISKKKVTKDMNKRIIQIRKIADELNATILLKGEVDTISDSHRVKLNYSGNPGMTVGGTGDVLAGVTAAFLSQKSVPIYSASAAAFITGKAGDLAFEKLGNSLLATDVIENIPKVIELNK
ncbi:MAG: NAD(P)H-hydrate dehydratase [Candidatus Ranarchaeia archaeon]